jgi:hypothetical protein
VDSKTTRAQYDVQHDIIYIYYIHIYIYIYRCVSIIIYVKLEDCANKPDTAWDRHFLTAALTVAPVNVMPMACRVAPGSTRKWRLIPRVVVVLAVRVTPPTTPVAVASSTTTHRQQTHGQACKEQRSCRP